MTEETEPTGGTSTVFRRGHVPHRPVGEHTPAGHRVLRHVRAAGCLELPEPLGTDGRSNETVTFLPVGCTTGSRRA